MMGRSRAAREGVDGTIMLSSEEEAPPCVSSAVSTWLAVGRYRLVRVVWHFSGSPTRALHEGGRVAIPPRGGELGSRGVARPTGQLLVRPERGGRGQN